MERLTTMLKNTGADTDGVINRLGGNERLYLSICMKFLQDSNYQMFLTALEENDINLAGIYIHTLKGVAANLGFTRLSHICGNIIEDLNNNDITFLYKPVQELTEEYNIIVTLLKSEQ